MNEELQKKLLELLGKAESFTTENAPLVFRDMILWAQIAWVLPFAMFCFSVWGIMWSIKLHNEYIIDRNLAELLICINVLLSAVLLVVTLFNTAAAIKATFAPYAFIVGGLT